MEIGDRVIVYSGQWDTGRVGVAVDIDSLSASVVVRLQDETRYAYEYWRVRKLEERKHAAGVFTVGTRVFIMEEAFTQEGGWMSGWSPRMNDYIWKQGEVVEDCGGYGYRVRFEDGEEFNFPSFSLERKHE